MKLLSLEHRERAHLYFVPVTLCCYVVSDEQFIDAPITKQPGVVITEKKKDTLTW